MSRNVLFSTECHYVHKARETDIYRINNDAILNLALKRNQLDISYTILQSWFKLHYPYNVKSGLGDFAKSNFMSY